MKINLTELPEDKTHNSIEYMVYFSVHRVLVKEDDILLMPVNFAIRYMENNMGEPWLPAFKIHHENKSFLNAYLHLFCEFYFK